MCSKMVALASGHPLQQNPPELLTEDAVDYEVHRAGKERKVYFSPLLMRLKNECWHLLTVTKRLFVWVSWWMSVPKKC